MNGASGAAVDDTREEMVSEPRGHGAARHEGPEVGPHRQQPSEFSLYDISRGCRAHECDTQPVKDNCHCCVVRCNSPADGGAKLLDYTHLDLFPRGFLGERSIETLEPPISQTIQ
jgi:hypothetical protein